MTTLALDWACRFDARLLGLGIVDEGSIRRPEPVPLGAGAYKRARDEARTAGAHREHPLRDLFATSVTRAVLGACPVPIFVGG